MIGRKKLFILFAFVLMIILISNIFAVTVKSYKPRYGITTERVNFRSTTSAGTSSIIKTINKSVRVKMVGEMDNYYIVQLSTNEMGLIAKTYVKTTTTPPVAKAYTSVTPYNATVLGNYTNVRRGPSTAFTRVTRLNKGASVKVIGKIGDFYAVIYGNNKVGMIQQNLVKKGTITTTTPAPTPTPTPAPTPAPTPSTTTPAPSNLSNVDLVLKYMNDERAAHGLPALTKDAKLMDIAQRKSNEMVELNYFLHTSPTYGTPFDMMSNFGITYKTAGENLAGNSTMKAVVDSWMNSPGHRANVLSNSYNYVGIGVTKSEKYGYVVSAMFIGK